MKAILSVIAVCLVMITVKLYIPEAEAGTDRWEIENIIEDCDVTGYVEDDYLYRGSIDC